MESNTEKNLQNLYKNWDKEIKSDNFCCRKVGSAITKWEAIENKSQYWINEEFDSGLKSRCIIQ